MKDQVDAIQYVFVFLLFLVMRLGSLYTQTKSCDHENLRALENHPMAIPWDIGIQICN